MRKVLRLLLLAAVAVGIFVALFLADSRGSGGDNPSQPLTSTHHYPPTSTYNYPPARNYTNCQEANANGVYDIPITDPDYWEEGARDKDGYACDSDGT
jgi:hypothetical protein